MVECWLQSLCPVHQAIQVNAAFPWSLLSVCYEIITWQFLLLSAMNSFSWFSFFMRPRDEILTALLVPRCKIMNQLSLQIWLYSFSHIFNCSPFVIPPLMPENCPYSEIFWSVFFHIRIRKYPDKDTIYAVFRQF